MKGILESLYHYMIPHPGNNHKPHLFRDHTVFFLMAFIIGTEFFVLTASLLFHQTSYFLSAILPNALVDLTNQERVKSTVPALAVNPILAHAAEAKAKDMAEKGYFAHTSPNGTTPWYWIMNAGYIFDRAGENLAVNFYGSEEVVNAWMNSPAHRANILSEGFTEIGIGLAEGMYQGKSVTFVVQMFGKPTAIAPVTFAEIRPAAQPPVTPVRITKVKSLPSAPAPVAVRAVTQVRTTSSPVVPSATVLSESTERISIPSDQPTPTQSVSYLSAADRVFLNPDIFLAYAYLMAALFVAIPLSLSLGIELKRGHMRHVLLGSTLFATLLLLAWFNQSGVLSATVLT